MSIFKMQLVILVMTLPVFLGCAGPNPNLGERTADTAWYHGDHKRAMEIIRPRAEAGYPWAQLRLGVIYELGVGVEINFAEAAKWYKKAAVQKAEGKWAEGILVGAMGKEGYFNQNSDARIAQYLLAKLYLYGKGVEKNLIEAYLNIRTVKEETKGFDIFYCCEFSGGRYITAKEIAATYEDIIKEISPDQLKTAEQLFPNRKPESE